MAVEQAVSVERDVGDRLLAFTDGSRLGLWAMDASA